MPRYMGGLGFRDFELFNLALLARQSWRILVSPNTLSARILKAVYFPSCSILEANLGNHPSQVWRSILEGRDIMKQGLVRRIGDGSSTEIWNTNWIPRPEFMRPMVSRVQDPPQLVSDLIDTANARWNMELVNQVFLPCDAAEILQIPICLRIVDDYWSWMHEKSGNFSVKSAYRMIVETKRRREDWLEQRPGPSNRKEEEKSWVKLWKTYVPAKLRVFLWRLVHHSIPTEDVRMHRNMSTSCTCAICGMPDSWRHSLLECTAARCVWSLVDRELIEELMENDEQNARSWLFPLLDKLSHEKFTKLTVTIWAIWWARRKLIHEGIDQSPLSTYMFITHFITELGEINPTSGNRLGNTAGPAPRRWIPAVQGHSKINVDAAVSRGVGTAAAVCRDSSGTYLGSSVFVIRGLTDPASLEAIACREGLSLAEDLGLQSLVIASDCETVVKHIKESSGGIYGGVVKEIQEWKSLFNSCIFKFESRSSNFEPHKLARHALMLDQGRHIWLGQPHDPNVIPADISID